MEMLGGSKKKVTLLISSIIIFFILNTFVLVLASPTVDVAYLITNKPEQAFIDVLNEFGYSYDIIFYTNIEYTDFSKYKMILVNNDNFVNWDKIPINEMPAVVAGGANVADWGWTTQSTRVSELYTIHVNINTSHEIATGLPGNIVAYTKTGPDIYLLDKVDVYNGFEIIASNTRDNKDVVVGLIKKGTTLTHPNPIYSPTYVGANSCFFGIYDSKFWTNESKALFRGCVGFVGMRCSSNSDCPANESMEPYCSNGNVYTGTLTYSCINPGLSSSQCVATEQSTELHEDCGVDGCGAWGTNYCTGNAVYHSRTCYDKGCSNGDCFSNGSPDITLVETCSGAQICSLGNCIDKPINCTSNSQCGTNGWLNQKTCNGDDVYDNYRTFTCNNAGTPESFCSNAITNQLRNECDLFCSGGECRDCLTDSQCSNDFYDDLFCSNGDVWHNFVNFSCQNFKCVSETIPILNDSCESDEICSNGSCKEITCSKHSDCGINGYIEPTYCSEFGLFSTKDFVSYTCLNPGQIDSECVDYTLPIYLEYCAFECISGECVNCFSNLSCGTDGYIGEDYCVDDDVYKDWKSFVCENAGTGDSDCSSSVSPKLIEECDDVCINGECREIECHNDTECDDSNLYTIDTCNNPATVDSYCSHTPVNCVTNNDCGFTGYFGQEYCSNDDVFKNYKNSTCVNGGTTESYCNILSSPKLILDCGTDSCDAWEENYCVGDDVYHSRTCYDNGCLDGGCFGNQSNQEELVKECADTCVAGACTNITCYDDVDCGIGNWTGELYCNGQTGNDSYQNTFWNTCVNAGSESSYCGIGNSSDLVEPCVFGCVDGSCVDLIHDVALIDFTNSVNQISLEYVNGTSILSSIPTLICGDVIKAKVKVENQGNYTENITLTGNLNITPFSLNPINNLISEDSTYRTSLTPYITIPGTEGFYNITVEALITVDNDLSDNSAQREIEVICPECTVDADCDNGLFCDGAESCVDNVCLAGTAVSCSVFSILGVSTCNNSPDDNPLTFDFRNPFTSSCDEGVNACTTGNNSISHLLYHPACYSPNCGNSIIDLWFGEECDDGNVIDGDGCSSTCQVETVSCYNDSSCGFIGWVGDYFCSTGDVYREYQNYTCSNPGTPSASCSSGTITNRLVGDCLLGCYEGKCLGCVA